MQYQLHYERKFYQDLKTGYWISTDYPRVRAHVWVWEYHHGPREKGYHIHHVDGDRSNNEISNLELKEQAEHLRMHMTQERRLLSAENARKHQHRTKEWHRSIEGRSWHKEHAKKFSFGKWELATIL